MTKELRFADSDKCPKCGETGDYQASEFQDFFIEQQAECPNGHCWVELSQVTHYVMLDGRGEAISEAIPVQIRDL